MPRFLKSRIHDERWVVAVPYFGPMIGRQQICKKQKGLRGVKSRQWCELSTEETSHIREEGRAKRIILRVYIFVSTDLARAKWGSWNEKC